MQGITGSAFHGQERISYDLANALRLSGEKSQSRSFPTAVGTYTTHRIIPINDVMLPCLSQNHTFTITLMVISQEYSHEMTY